MSYRVYNLCISKYMISTYIMNFIMWYDINIIKNGGKIIGVTLFWGSHIRCDKIILIQIDFDKLMTYIIICKATTIKWYQEI